MMCKFEVDFPFPDYFICYECAGDSVDSRTCPGRSFRGFLDEEEANLGLNLCSLYVHPFVS